MFVTPVDTLALHYLLSMHLLQNVVLAEWAPALLVASLPAAVAARAASSAAFRALTHPLVALPLWLGNYFVWHVPAIYDAALRRPDSLLHLEHLAYLVTGFLMWWPVLHDAPHRIRSGGRAAYLFAAFGLAAPRGLLLALIPRAVYDFYVEAPRVWGLTPLEDQQLAGITMASEEAIVFFAVFVVFFLRFLREEEPAVETALRYPR